MRLITHSGQKCLLLQQWELYMFVIFGGEYWLIIFWTTLEYYELCILAIK